MAYAKFSAGQRVSVARAIGLGAPQGFFQIVRPLPREDAGPQQYRVRAEGETFERVVEEARLEPASLD